MSVSREYQCINFSKSALMTIEHDIKEKDIRGTILYNVSITVHSLFKVYEYVELICKSHEQQPNPSSESKQENEDDVDLDDIIGHDDENKSTRSFGSSSTSSTTRDQFEHRDKTLAIETDNTENIESVSSDSFIKDLRRILKFLNTSLTNDHLDIAELVKTEYGKSPLKGIVTVLNQSIVGWVNDRRNKDSAAVLPKYPYEEYQPILYKLMTWCCPGIHTDMYHLLYMILYDIIIRKPILQPGSGDFKANNMATKYLLTSYQSTLRKYIGERSLTTSREILERITKDLNDLVM